MRGSSRPPSCRPPWRSPSPPRPPPIPVANGHGFVDVPVYLLFGRNELRQVRAPVRPPVTLQAVLQALEAGPSSKQYTENYTTAVPTNSDLPGPRAARPRHPSGRARLHLLPAVGTGRHPRARTGRLHALEGARGPEGRAVLRQRGKDGRARPATASTSPARSPGRTTPLSSRPLADLSRQEPRRPFRCAPGSGRMPQSRNGQASARPGARATARRGASDHSLSRL